MRKTNGSHEEITVDEIAERLYDIVHGSTSVDEMLYYNDIKNRRLLLNTDIVQCTVADAVSHIMRYDREDIGIPVEQRKPIVLYVVSGGGDVFSGFELIDVIENSKTPVYTVNLGYQYSMAFVIGLAGHKRYAMKNSSFLMHDGSSYMSASSSKAQDQAEFLRRVDNRVRDYIISKSNLTLDEYNSKERVEWYLFADEAKEKGFTDYIIGVDCEMDEVL